MKYLDGIDRVGGPRRDALLRSFRVFASLEEITQTRLSKLYSRRTLRKISTELVLLRKAGATTPAYTHGVGTNGLHGFYYRWPDVLRFFEGVNGMLHKDDYPELFELGTRPSTRLRHHRRHAV